MSDYRFVKMDSAKNAKRFYVVSVERDLFGTMCLVRRWGRLGTRGLSQSVPYRSMTAARAALDKEIARRVRRGYQVTR